MSAEPKPPEKMALKSLDVAKERRDALKALFPSVFTETNNDKGELVESIDFEKLKVELGAFTDIFEARRERYGMDWPGKKECMKLIQQPSIATLKPCRDESVNFDTTENLFIEGDNLEVLKLLQKSYYGKVKMIYIDPPYNTGKEFIYPDKYAESLDTYLAYAGLLDDEGKKFMTNTPNEGRFHTKWLNMMYPRLYLASNLLKEDGVIFISIDDGELMGLRDLCNTVFGEENFIGCITRVAKTTSFRGNYLAPGKDYLLCYGKNLLFTNVFKDEIDYSQYNKIENEGPRKGEKYRDDIAFYLRTLETRPNQRYYIECPDGSMVLPPGNTFFPDPPMDGDGVWRWNKDTFEKKRHLIVFKSTQRSPLIDGEGSQAKWNLYTKSYLQDRIEEGNIPRDFWTDFLNRHGTSELKKLSIPFSFPKPSSLIVKLLKIVQTESSDVILDFFSGSCTTAHAVLDLNKEDGQNRKFIMVQLPEPCEEKSEAFKAGYKTIADVGKERIRRVIKKIEEERESKNEEATLPGMEDKTPELDLGFRVLKLNTSNFRIWDGTNPDTLEAELSKQLELHIDHIASNASQEDILFELLLKAGFKPTEKIEKRDLAGKTVFSISEGALFICLEDEITSECIDAVAEAEPLQFICLDRGFQGNDQLKANTVQTFAARNQGREKAEQIVFRTV